MLVLYLIIIFAEIFLKRVFRGPLGSLFCYIYLMIEKSKIISLVEERLEDDMFIVDVSVNERNVIKVFIYSMSGLSIENCVSVSRNVEHKLDREEEDFELQVSSPGLSEGFKVLQQYKKYLGKNVEVDTGTQKLEGLLKEANEEEFVVETSTREKVEGHKKKQVVVKQHKFKYDEIKSTKAVISFK